MLTKQQMIDKTNEAIAELVVEKEHLTKAYNYYAGIRDKEQYKYLEENFGIGNPTSVEFTPLIKKHVDALVGEYLGFPTLPKISCKDAATISNIHRDKQLQIKAAINRHLSNHLNNFVIRMITGKSTSDEFIQEQLDKVVDDLNQSFVSDYEIAAQNVVQYIMQSRSTDFETKKRQLLLDLLISGETYYQTGETPSGTNINFEVLNTKDVFPDMNPDSIYVKDASRVVVRKWYTVNQILNKYGHDLTKDEVKVIRDNLVPFSDNSHYGYIPGTEKFTISASRITQDDPNIDKRAQNKNLFPVYEVEWIEVDENFVMQRYKTIRINGDIFITKGIDETVIRSQDNPTRCGLSVNGVIFYNRSNKPYSLVLACVALQDKYDILNYYRDTIIANSGVKGQIIDFSLIPTFLGGEWAERIAKWQAYRKAGDLIIDTSQEGRNENGTAPLNTIFNGYDDTVAVQAIQAIQMAIDSVEATVSSITGVFRERLNGIEQRDAVSNIKQGVTNSFIVTKHIFQQMDLIICELLMDGLNQAKYTWRKGLTGTIILGEYQQKIFTALPQHFTLTDFDIHIISSSQIMEEMERTKAIIPELVKGGVMPPEAIIECLSAQGYADLRYKVRKAIKQQKDENNIIQKLQQQVEESTKQAQQLSKELEKAQQQIKALDEKRLELEQRKIQLEFQVDNFKAQTERTYRENWYDVEKRKVTIEAMQLNDGNPYNDKVNFDK